MRGDSVEKLTNQLAGSHDNDIILGYFPATRKEQISSFSKCSFFLPHLQLHTGTGDDLS